MRNITRGALALVGAGALSLGVLAAPASADLGDPISLAVENDTFTAGSWGEGVDFVVTDVPEEVDEITLTIGSAGRNGAGPVADPIQADEQTDGSYTGNITPPREVAPVAPDADGFPEYTATASYSYEDAEGEAQFVSDSVELTIEEGLSVSGPENATVGELAEGIDLEFAGFQPDESIDGDIEFFNPETGEYDTIGDFAATLGPDGSGEGTLTIINASPGNAFRVSIDATEGTVNYYVTATEDDGTIPTDPAPSDPQAGDEDDEDSPAAPTRPERVDTGA
ncbi:hypothetical protein ACHAAC_03990 [Aeromicrobium sp. CF4.19]|uniref:hypothetical protein n=1 Tax=Aeromicrobium sp. CF4.19 TaxID=3373082 RepID=UPI003EE6CA03